MNFNQLRRNIVEEAWKFVEKHWQGLFVACTTVGLIISILGEFSLKADAMWLCILIASLITISDAWGKFLDKSGQLLWKLFLVMLGSKGLTMALFLNGTILFLSSVLVFMNQPGNRGGGAMIGAVGLLMLIGGLVSIPAKKIHGGR